MLYSRLNCKDRPGRATGLYCSERCVQWFILEPLECSILSDLDNDRRMESKGKIYERKIWKTPTTQDSTNQLRCIGPYISYILHLVISYLVSATYGVSKGRSA